MRKARCFERMRAADGGSCRQERTEAITKATLPQRFSGSGWAHGVAARVSASDVDGGMPPPTDGADRAGRPRSLAAEGATRKCPPGFGVPPGEARGGAPAGAGLLAVTRCARAGTVVIMEHWSRADAISPVDSVLGKQKPGRLLPGNRFQRDASYQPVDRIIIVDRRTFTGVISTTPPALAAASSAEGAKASTRTRERP